MNKRLHRILFNRARGVLMAVAETAGRQGKAAGGEREGPGRTLSAPVKPLAWCLWFALGMVSGVTRAEAQVIADRSAPRHQQPTVLVTPRGAPQVNIQVPSAAGVSRNTYTQFDVQQPGVVLNNARTGAVTQVGGAVGANPWLARGTARVILNEVNSSNPSQLRGYVEVAGDKAQVVIANPAGITCDGCGFINATRATVTTGTPIVNGGHLDGYRVERGDVEVKGAGMDSRGADYTDLIARSTQVNAGIWAKNLKITSGPNQVSADNAQATPVAGTGTAPAYAVDTAQLGGMYAGKIVLVGTEAGVGMRNAGNIGASAGEVRIAADGLLHNSGQITAATQVSVDTRSGIVNSGTVYAGGDATLNTRGDVRHGAGLIGAGGHTRIAATGADSQVTLEAGATVAAGLHTTGEGEQARTEISGTVGDIGIEATRGTQAQGTLAAAGDLRVTAKALDFSHARLSGQNLWFAAQAGDIEATGATVRASQALSLSSPQALRTDGATLSAARLDLHARDWSNRDGQLVQTGEGPSQVDVAGRIDNTGGLIAAAHGLQVRDAAKLAGQSDLAITNTGGTLAADDLRIAAGRLTLDGKLDAGDLDLQLGGSLVNTGQILARRSLTLTLPGDFRNAAVLSASQRLSITAANIDNTATGELSAGSTRLTASGGVTNRGLIDGDDTVLRAATVDNIGTGRIYGTRLGVEAAVVNNTDEASYARRNGPLVSPWSASWYQAASGGAAPGGAAVIAARARLDLGAATVNNGEGANIVSEGDIHFGARLDANDQATGRGQLVHNTSGRIQAAGHIDWGNVEQVVNERAHLAFASTTDTVSSQKVLLDTGGSGTYRIVQDLQTRTTHATLSNEQSSAPGMILSGDGMAFGSARITNNASGIYAWGRLDHDPSKYETPATGWTQTVETGITTAFSRDSCNILNGCHFKNNRETKTAITGLPSTTVSSADGAQMLGELLTSGQAPPLLYVNDAALPSRAGALHTGTAPTVPAASEVQAADIDLRLPTSSLFQTRSAPGGRFLVTTDPRFAGYRQWLDSDYQLRQLGIDPATLVAPRFADGYYEQRLIREQTSQLIGKRVLDKNENNETEYLMLMDNGVLYAKANGLKPGTALTPEQIAKLPADMVWLVSRDITLSDGSKTQALVPQVYARVAPATPDAAVRTGSTVAGNRIDYQLAGDYALTGTLKARDSLSIQAENINNLGGRIQAANVLLVARTDLNNTGGQVIGTDSLQASAGRDLNVTSTLASRQYGNAHLQYGSTGIAQVGSLEVGNAGGTLLLEAGRDLHLTAVRLSNTGEGSLTAVSAKNDLHLDTLTTREDQGVVLDAGNHSRSSRMEEVGTLIESGDAWLQAGRDIQAKALRVNGASGVVSLDAGRDLNLLAGQQTLLTEDARWRSRESLFRKTTTVTADRLLQNASVQSELSGDSVQLKAGQDLTVQASTVNAANLLALDAGRDLLVNAAQDSREETYLRHSFREANRRGMQTGLTLNSLGLFDFGYAAMQKKSQDGDATQTQTAATGSTLNAGTVQSHSGRDTLLEGATVVADGDVAVRAERHLSLGPAEQSKQDATHAGSHVNGQIGSWYQPAMGSVKQSQDGHGSSSTLSGTQVASLGGNVGLQAGEAYTQTASQVLAPKGDIGIEARQVQIEAGRELGESVQTGRHAKTAFGGTVSIPLVSAIQGIRGTVKASKDTGSDRMKALAAVTAGLQTANAAGSVMDSGAMGGIKVSVNLSHQESKNEFEQRGSNAVGSRVSAGGDVSIRATGAGQDSRLAVIGSQVDAGGDVRLKSDGSVLLKAAENTATQHSTDSSSGVSIGIGFAIGGQQNGFTIDLAASQSRGKADGTDSVWTNTHVAAGKRFSVESGGDTTLQGTVVSARQITGDIGGKLKIESLQDVSTYKSAQVSAGFAVSLCIEPLCFGMSSLSVNASQSKIDSNFTGVGEQSGFKAGDGGYQIQVKGDTELIGGVIASSDQAIVDGRNRFDHGGAVTQRDLRNRAEFKASATSVGVGVGEHASASFGAGADAGFQTSVTQSGIGVSTSQDTAGVIAPIFDAGKVQREINAQTRITQNFSQAAPQAVARLAKSKMKPVTDASRYETLQDKQSSGQPLTPEERGDLTRLRAEGMTSDKAQATLSDPKALEDYNHWKEGGTYRVAAHTAVGALGGGAGGALGAGGVAAAAPMLQDLQDGVAGGLVEHGASPETAVRVSQGLAELTSAGLGAVVGGTQGAGSALATDTNNRMLHAGDHEVARQLARKSDGQYAEEEILGALRASGLRDDKGNLIVAEGTRETYIGTGANLINIANGLSFGDTLKLDSGIVLRPDPQTPSVLLEDKPVRPSNELMGYILGNTGGASSNYVFTLAPRVSNASALPDAPQGTTRVSASVDGFSYFPLVANCPAVACTNGDPIALGLQDEGTQAYLVALARKSEKELNVASLAFGLAGSLVRAGVAIEKIGAMTAADGAGSVAAKVTTTAVDGTASLELGAGEASSKVGVNPSLLNELATNGVKFTPESVIATARSPSGQVVFLEAGNSASGLKHIVQEHAADFANIGVSEAEIPTVVTRAVSEGNIVGYQGRGTGRPIYEVSVSGRPQRIAVTTGSNGYIVGANPVGRTQ